MYIYPNAVKVLLYPIIANSMIGIIVLDPTYLVMKVLSLPSFKTFTKMELRTLHPKRLIQKMKKKTFVTHNSLSHTVPEFSFIKHLFESKSVENMVLLDLMALGNLHS